jgi:large subunit ribosomal protein L35
LVAGGLQAVSRKACQNVAGSRTRHKKWQVFGLATKVAGFKLATKVARGHQGCMEYADASRAQRRRSIHMPKMKTKSSAKKRFRVRPGGTVKRGQAFKRHILTKKTTKNKRHLRGSVSVHETNMVSMAAMLPGMGI